MPIKDKSRYPTNWNEIAHRIKVERAKSKCEFCGVAQFAIGYRLSNGQFRPYALPAGASFREVKKQSAAGGLKLIRIVLAVAHLDHTPEHSEEENLACLCQFCHLNYDRAVNLRRMREGTHQNQLKIFIS